MPKSDGSLTAVVVSGGKQYRVTTGDRILVDRLTAEPGTEIALDRVLLLAQAGDVKIGTPALAGVALNARVIAHTRGQKIDVLRYKSKKRVRVHRGARADLTSLEILGLPGEAPAKKTAQTKTTAPAEKAAKPARAAGGRPVDEKAEKPEVLDGA
ncbi:MAG: 50S ribosomal protein L21 [Candidatus Dormibacteraceae bacterium]